MSNVFPYAALMASTALLPKEEKRFGELILEFEDELVPEGEIGDNMSYFPLGVSDEVTLIEWAQRLRINDEICPEADTIRAAYIMSVGLDGERIPHDYTKLNQRVLLLEGVPTQYEDDIDCLTVIRLVGNTALTN